MKKWTAPTVIAQIRAHAQEIYGADVLSDHDSAAKDVTLGEFVNDLLSAQLQAQMVQIAGQTVIVPDEEGNVSIGMVTDRPDDTRVSEREAEEKVE